MLYIASLLNFRKWLDSPNGCDDPISQQQYKPFIHKIIFLGRIWNFTLKLSCFLNITTYCASRISNFIHLGSFNYIPILERYYIILLYLNINNMINDSFEYKYSEIGNIPIFKLATLIFKHVFLYIISFFSFKHFHSPLFTCLWWMWLMYLYSAFLYIKIL